jgi:ABC-2 type transport system permease protein
MLPRIMVTDWRNLAADRSLPVAVGLFLAMIAYGSYNGAAWTGFQRSTLEQSAREEKSRMAGLEANIRAAEVTNPTGFGDPRSPAFVGGREGTPYLRMPPAALAPLSIGQSDLFPYYVRAALQSVHTVMAADEVENPANLLAGRFDLAFVIVYLYPLLILGLTYNVISAEREQGTLAMTLAQPVSLGAVVWGKVLARAGVLVGAGLIACVAAAIIGGVTLNSGREIGLLAAWLAMVAAYGAFWFALAVLVNALGRSSPANALVLIASWLALVLILPSLVHVTATTRYPVPSRVEMVQAVREASREASANGSRLLAQYLEDHPELAPQSGGGADFLQISTAVNKQVEQKVEPVLDHFDAQLRAQQAMVSRFRFLSPAILTQAALNDLSGTGDARQEHFRRQVAAFLERWRGYFEAKIFRREKIKAGDLAGLPRFEYQEEPPGAATARFRVGLWGVLLPAALLVMIAARMLRRYPVAGS